MSAAVSRLDDLDADTRLREDDAARGDDISLEELVAVEQRARARWDAELAALAEEDAAAEPPDAEHASADPFADLLPSTSIADDLAALVERMKARQAEADAHRAVCTRRLCDGCGRYACSRCLASVVEDRSTPCARCQLAEASEAMQIPRRYRDAYKHVATRVRAKEARRLSARELNARALVAKGPIGSGKTTLVVALMQARARQDIAAGYSVGALFASAISLERARVEHRLGDGEAALITDAIEAELLVIDDLGAESPREPVLEPSQKVGIVTAF